MRPFCFLFLFIAPGLYAQDTIIKRNSERVIAKVIEISPTEVKYKKFDFQDGPLYIDKKADISMILFASGLKESFPTETPLPAKGPENLADNRIDDRKMQFYYHGHRISQQYMHSILMQTRDKKIMSIVQEAKKARRIEFCWIGVFPLSYAALYFQSRARYPSADRDTYYTYAVLCGAAAISCPVISIVNKSKKMRANSAAIALYNQQFP